MLLACGCDERPTAPRPTAPPAAPPVAFRHLAERDVAAPLPTVEGVVEDAGAIPEVVARCVARSTHALSPELSAALGVLESDALLEDGCRLDLAPRLAQPTLCEGVRATALRDACTARAAIVMGVPERCPASPGMRGRDPECVALSARDPRLCAAAPGGERARCVALAHADGRACARVDVAFARSCARELAALGPWLVPRRGEALGDGAVWLEERGVDDAGEALHRWELRAQRRGAWLDEGAVLWLADPSPASARATEAAGVEAVAWVRVPTAGVEAGQEVTAEARVVVPGAAPIATSEGTARAVATFDVVPRARGDRVALRVRVDGATAGLGRALVLTVESFVRDVAMRSSLQE